MEHREAGDENRPAARRKQINTGKRVHKKLHLTCTRMYKLLMSVGRTGPHEPPHCFAFVIRIRHDLSNGRNNKTDQRKKERSTDRTAGR